MKRYPYKVHFHNKEIRKAPVPANFAALCTWHSVDKITLNEDEVTCQNCLIKMGKMDSTRKRNVKGEFIK